MNIEQIRRALQSLNLSRVSRDTGVSLTTLLAIKNNAEANPTLRTLQSLERYIKALAGGVADD